jgi:hypothetical protein
MAQDIRDRAYIDHDDVIALNFIRNPSPYAFRRHFRQGLRSHILEVLAPAEVNLEKEGVVRDGVRWYPKARPHRIFRIFRARLKTLENALEEIARVKIIEKYLAPDYLAKSTEFLVDYFGPEGPDLMLCGFQVYVEGQIIDPWGLLAWTELGPSIYRALCPASDPDGALQAQWIRRSRRQAAAFVARIKRMILEKAHVPDLAGVGNLVMVASGHIKLVDMNNISRAALDPVIRLDDRGYPVCDKSIEALYLLERQFFGNAVDQAEAIYRHFLDPRRRRQVQACEEGFQLKIASGKVTPHA